MGDFLPDEQAAADMEWVQERQAEQTIVCALQSSLNTFPPLQAQVIRCRFYAQLTRPQTAQAAESDIGSGAAGGIKSIAKSPLESGGTGRELGGLFIMIYQVCDIRK